MRLGSIFIICAVLATTFSTSTAEARTRAPKNENERSLLYWRYLCENQAQKESVPKSSGYKLPIELECLAQNWKVTADGGQVKEVVEDAKK